MKCKSALLILLGVVALPLAAQEPVITIDQEPHHHAMIHNAYVSVHRIEVGPNDGFLMHRHDEDEVSVVITGGTSIGRNLGQPETPPRTSVSGSVGYGRSGRAHATRNVGQTTIHNVASSLLIPQGTLRNLCFEQVKDQPLNCPGGNSDDPQAPFIIQPRFETDQTRVTYTRVRPQQSAPVGDPDRERLIVAIDEIVVTGGGHGGEKVLRAGDIVWLTAKDAPAMLKNIAGKEARIVTLAFKPI